MKNKESTKGVKAPTLTVQKTSDSTGLGIFFDEMEIEDHNVSIAYHRAIEQVLKENNLFPIQKTSQVPKSGWEALANPEEEDLRSLIPQIHQRAAKVLREIEDDIDMSALLKQKGPARYTF